TNVISTLDLNLLTKGGGSWNVDGVNMKKSAVTTFDGKRVVKAVYDKNSGTSANPGVGGFSFSAVPDGLNKNAITFAWEVFYPKGFDFARGGKHGGTFIGHGAASGYQHSKTGASNRIMWQEKGGVIDYIYPPSDLKQKIPGLDPEGHGIGFFQDDFKNALKYDVWNRIEIGTKMNTFKNGIPQLDGESYVIVNGKKEVLKRINWSRSPDLLISRFDWNTFFGGPLPSPKNQVAYFTNFQMKKYELEHHHHHH
uniref:VAL-1 n=1 Tax=Paramecium bursaria Chlorella virus CVK2 TaxID=31555 RepID=UPI0001BE6362|nr:Chain A, Val-1 [Paramecium bursaria Chlorella virus CVK2]3GNE_A Chain A, Val-1 [Paramecium bursaria Chlorella virus CVK2]3GNE_B Chain B, Val-1 [Paramecium bursaria Chlorella virus CVK2]3IM0_A Chain A, VAL-1 [Paramecium bursaria Chlorella virus CVK2]